MPVTYALLLLLGAMEGLIGCFQYPHSVGSVPVAALGLCALILLTCVLASAGMGSPVAGLLPAIGWVLTSFLLTMPTAAGSVIVTNTVAGKWYLYGGAICAGVGVLISFSRQGRRRAVRSAARSASRRPGTPGTPGSPGD